MFQANALAMICTQILSSVTLSFESRAVYEIIWINILEPDRPQMKLWRMRNACSIPMATKAHLEYVIRNCFSTATMVTLTCFSLILYGSNRGWGKIFRIHPDLTRGPLSLLCIVYRVCLPGVQRPMRSAEHPPHLAPASSMFRAITLAFSLCLHSI